MRWVFFLIPEMGGPEFKAHFATTPVFSRLHIIPGGIAMILGVFQDAFGLNFDEAYDIVAWFCWVPNLIIAEWLFIQMPLRGSRAPSA